MEEIPKFSYSTTTTTTTTATTTITTITTTTTTRSTTTITNFSTLLLSDFFVFLSFISSHPLYFLYFIFFSPYLLKLLSFLSPLFLTTSLLLLALFTVSPTFLTPQQPLLQLPADSKTATGFLINTYHSLINTLRSRLDDQKLEFPLFDGLIACIEFLEECRPIHELSQAMFELHDTRQVIDQVRMNEKTSRGGDNKLKSANDSKSDNVIEDTNFLMNIGTYVNEFCSDNGGEYTSKVKEDIKRSTSSNLEICGSMRREKEWKRTLACKLFEERQNVDGSEEGMDSLWEAYEDKSGKTTTKKKTLLTRKKSEIEYDDDDDDDEDEEEEDMNHVQMCCLHALKFSTGKMNLGMRRPNLVKISKALKGIGWFHHVSRRGKKA